MDTKIEQTRPMRTPLAGRMTKPWAFIKGKLKVLAIVLLLAVGGLLAFLWWNKKDTAADYVTDKVTKGSIEVTVSATGTVQAVTTVQVGSQVSGAVSWLGADFKSQVKQGQVIAKLDPALFQAQVDTASANLLNAQAGVQAAMTDIQNQNANIEAAKANDRANQAQRDDAIQIAKQNEKLRGVITDREIEAAQNAAKVAIARYSQASSQIAQAQAQLQISQSKLKQAQAGVAQSKAQLEQANVNLQHTIISSPIDGVVVSRSVDVGQTVAASLSAPTLFTIANDLTNMQVLASIDEADVGQVKERGTAHFTVDAYPGQTFNGNILQVRLNAQTLQNVVTYSAVISVQNPDLKLMPGMTANITIPVARRDDVLRVPNGALRFKPELTDQQQKDLQAKIDAFRQQQAAAPNTPEADQTPSDNKQGQPAGKDKGAGGDQAAPGDKQRHGSLNGGSGGQHRSQGQNQGNATPTPGGGGGGQQRHQRPAAAASPEAGNDNSAQPATDQTPASGKQRHGNGNQPQAGTQSGGAGKHRGDGTPSQGGQVQNGAGGGKHKPGADQGGSKKTQAAATTADNQPSPSPAGGSGGGGGGGRGGSGKRQQIQVIWTMNANKTFEAHIIRTGITDGRFTEIIAGDLKEGDVIVVGGGPPASSNSNRNSQPTSPLSPRPPGAGGGGRGR
jgi:HlyD family secretion protein